MVPKEIGLNWFWEIYGKGDEWGDSEKEYM
jgi:hypothetical protein